MKAMKKKKKRKRKRVWKRKGKGKGRKSVRKSEMKSDGAWCDAWCQVCRERRGMPLRMGRGIVDEGVGVVTVLVRTTVAWATVLLVMMETKSGRWKRGRTTYYYKSC